jgi:hypothetical protein
VPATHAPRVCTQSKASRCRRPAGTHPSSIARSCHFRSVSLSSRQTAAWCTRTNCVVLLLPGCHYPSARVGKVIGCGRAIRKNIRSAAAFTCRMMEYQLAEQLLLHSIWSLWWGVEAKRATTQIPATRLQLDPGQPVLL